MLWDQFGRLARIPTMQALIFVAAETERAPLTRAARTSNTVEFQIFEATAKARRLEVWELLVHAAHLMPAKVFIGAFESLPGGPWSWIKQLSRLAALDAQLVCLREPSVTLDGGQGELLRVLATAREHEIRERTRAAVEKARASGRHVGRPNLKVPVDQILETRTRMSLRETARHFGISTTSVWRICQEAQHLRSRSEDVAR